MLSAELPKSEVISAIRSKNVGRLLRWIRGSSRKAKQSSSNGQQALQPEPLSKHLMTLFVHRGFTKYQSMPQTGSKHSGVLEFANIFNPHREGKHSEHMQAPDECCLTMFAHALLHFILET